VICLIDHTNAPRFFASKARGRIEGAMPNQRSPFESEWGKTDKCTCTLSVIRDSGSDQPPGANRTKIE
jgi:hypothetical protein